MLKLLRSDLSERDIGRELYVSHYTVHSHVRSIYRKLAVRSRADVLERSRNWASSSERPRANATDAAGRQRRPRLSSIVCEHWSVPGRAVRTGGLARRPTASPR